MPTQVFARADGGTRRLLIVNISSMNAFTAADQDSRLLRRQGGDLATSPSGWRCTLRRAGIRGQRHRPRASSHKAERGQLLWQRRTARPTPAHRQNSWRRTPMGRFGEAGELSGALLFLSATTRPPASSPASCCPSTAASPLTAACKPAHFPRTQKAPCAAMPHTGLSLCYARRARSNTRCIFSFVATPSCSFSPAT